MKGVVSNAQHAARRIQLQYRKHAAWSRSCPDSHILFPALYLGSHVAWLASLLNSAFLSGNSDPDPRQSLVQQWQPSTTSRVLRSFRPTRNLSMWSSPRLRGKRRLRCTSTTRLAEFVASTCERSNSRNRISMISSKVSSPNFPKLRYVDFFIFYPNLCLPCLFFFLSRKFIHSLPIWWTCSTTKIITKSLLASWIRANT